MLKILGDFKWAQIKTIQFLTYLVKDFTAEIVPQRNAICDATAGLLCTAPDTHAVRKELLVTTRHMIQSKELQEGFYPHLAVFLVDGNLVGRQTLTSEQLRPMAYSLLAELVHHMRETLTAAQLADVVHLFCCLLHDPSIPPSIATTCVRRVSGGDKAWRPRERAMGEISMWQEAFSSPHTGTDHLPLPLSPQAAPQPGADHLPLPLPPRLLLNLL